ncbi:Hypothetical protein A7982_10879 [Minicystis rosea]|nr:Hypothetical protein A7982_10879 [Minicystis rosea]
MERALAVAVAACILFGGAAARADQPAHTEAPGGLGEARRAEAKALALRGDAEFYAGNCDKAMSLWQSAESTFHAPTILLRVARCQVQLGKLVAASATLEKIAAEVPRSDAPAAFVSAREEAKRDLAAVRVRVATLRVVVHARDERAPVIVEIDGVAQAQGATVFPADPGEHAVRVRAGASSWQTTVKLKEGELVGCDVALWAERDPKRPRAQRMLGLAALGVGGAALAAGLGLSIAALVTSHAHSPPEEVNRARALSTGAASAVGAGAAILVAGAVTLATAPRPDGDAWRVQIAASPFSATLRIDF